MYTTRKLRRLSPEELINIIVDQQNKIEELNEIIKNTISSNIKLETVTIKPQLDPSKYHQDWDWMKKCVFIVSLLDRPVRSNEILEEFLKHDRTAKYWRDKTRSLSVHLNKAIRYKCLLPYKIMGIRGYYYTLPEWFNEKGELKSEYKINPYSI